MKSAFGSPLKKFGFRGVRPAGIYRDKFKFVGVVATKSVPGLASVATNYHRHGGRGRGGPRPPRRVPAGVHARYTHTHTHRARGLRAWRRRLPPPFSPPAQTKGLSSSPFRPPLEAVCPRQDPLGVGVCGLRRGGPTVRTTIRPGAPSLAFQGVQLSRPPSSRRGAAGRDPRGRGVCGYTPGGRAAALEPSQSSILASTAGQLRGDYPAGAEGAPGECGQKSRLVTTTGC